jgi:hypothetical protein
MEERQFDYDVTLSFAEEDRPFVECVAQQLSKKGLRFYYDEYERIDMWGKNLYTHLDNIYRNKAKYCVMFVSKYYKIKLWTQHERVSAQARAFRENSEYILPFRFDDTEIPGLLDLITYLTRSQYDCKGLADAIEQKVRGPQNNLASSNSSQNLKANLNKFNPAKRTYSWKDMAILGLLSSRTHDLSLLQRTAKFLSKRIKFITITISTAVVGVAAYTLSDHFTPVAPLAKKIYDRSKKTVHGSQCRDGSFSFSQGRGTCSYHGGVYRRVDTVMYTKTKDQCYQEAKTVSWLHDPGDCIVPQTTP